jgi:hypothetical protein
VRRTYEDAWKEDVVDDDNDGVRVEKKKNESEKGACVKCTMTGRLKRVVTGQRLWSRGWVGPEDDRRTTSGVIAANRQKVS